MIEKYKLWKTDLDSQSKMEYKSLEKLQVGYFGYQGSQPGSTIEFSKMWLTSQRSHVSC